MIELGLYKELLVWRMHETNEGSNINALKCRYYIKDVLILWLMLMSLDQTCCLFIGCYFYYSWNWRFKFLICNTLRARAGVF